MCIVLATAGYMAQPNGCLGCRLRVPPSCLQGFRVVGSGDILPRTMRFLLDVLRVVPCANAVSMHGYVGLAAPQGPCVMSDSTKARSSFWSSPVGISADTKRSTSLADLGLLSCSNIRRMWAWGNPRFWNSMTYVKAFTRPKQCSTVKSCNNAFRFCRKTRAMRSGRLWACSPGRRLAVTSGHFGLAVIVMKASGRPYFATVAIASKKH